MPVNIHGKEYRTVAERVQDFHADKDHGSILTEVVKHEGNMIIVKATVIVGGNTYIGHGMEVIGSSQINKTSALENAETSAVGRALAFAGWGGTEIASADEVANAIRQQNAPPIQAPAAAPAKQTYREGLEEDNLRRDICKWVGAICGDDKDEAAAIIKQLSQFEGRDGKMKYKTSTRDLNGKWLKSTWKKAKEMYEANMPPEDENQDEGYDPEEWI